MLVNPRQCWFQVARLDLRVHSIGDLLVQNRASTRGAYGCVPVVLLTAVPTYPASRLISTAQAPPHYELFTLVVARAIA